MIKRPSSKRKTPIPRDVRACLWFSDPKELNLDEDKEIIITQVLNRGTWKSIRWLFCTYGPKAIRKVVCNPRRGVWFAQTLDFWSLFFGVTIPRKLYMLAVIRL